MANIVQLIWNEGTVYKYFKMNTVEEYAFCVPSILHELKKKIWIIYTNVCYDKEL